MTGQLVEIATKTEFIYPQAGLAVVTGIVAVVVYLVYLALSAPRGSRWITTGIHPLGWTIMSFVILALIVALAYGPQYLPLRIDTKWVVIVSTVATILILFRGVGKRKQSWQIGDNSASTFSADILAMGILVLGVVFVAVLLVIIYHVLEGLPGWIWAIFGVAVVIIPVIAGHLIGNKPANRS